MIYDSNDNRIDLPDMVRENTDADTVARLVGDYLYDVEGTMTAGDYTLTLGSFLMDEQGMGVLTCRLENPNGIAYQDGSLRLREQRSRLRAAFSMPKRGNASFLRLSTAG